MANKKPAPKKSATKKVTKKSITKKKSFLTQEVSTKNSFLVVLLAAFVVIAATIILF